MRPPTVTSLPFSGDPEADALLVSHPLALLIGFVLDQQVTVQKAFGGPLALKRRLGTLDAAAIAALDPADLEATFREPPALHRFPADMARRTQALCALVATRYAGDASRVWREAADGPDLERRLVELPGIGPGKARTLIAILARRFDVRPPGWEDVLPVDATLGDVDSYAALAAYQEQKRARKRELRAASGRPGETGSGARE